MRHPVKSGHRILNQCERGRIDIAALFKRNRYKYQEH